MIQNNIFLKKLGTETLPTDPISDEFRDLVNLTK
jgi:hypothetical protein